MCRHTQPAEDDPNVVRMWTMTQGTVLCIDQRFSDWFGKLPNELVGKPFHTIAAEQVRRARAGGRAGAARRRCRCR